jgi:hypothetical protein
MFASGDGMRISPDTHGYISVCVPTASLLLPLSIPARSISSIENKNRRRSSEQLSSIPKLHSLFSQNSGCREHQQEISFVIAGYERTERRRRRK